ncbi:MAG: disulfide bond formation protein B [Chlamydiales bacterium]
MFIQKYGLYFAWLGACIGTMGSLYFSELAHMQPCNLCWYQRICLFPLAVILGVAAYRGFLAIARYVLPQVILGVFFALYQIALQEIPGWNPIDLCGAGPSCADRINIIGFITIPMLSLGGFIIIGAILIWVWTTYQDPLSSCQIEE